MLCRARLARHSRSQRSSARACAVLLASLAVIGSLVQQSDAARPVPTPGRKLSQLLPTPDPGLSPAVPEFPPVLPTRVLFDPNKGDIDRINDYTANVYFGEVDIAEADPVIAAAGGVAGAGVRVVYGTGTNFDYEAPTSSLTVGPGAKAIGAAIARINGGASAKVLGRLDGNTNINYNRNAWNGNSATVGTTTTLNRGISAGAYLDRTSGNDNDALLEQPAVNNWAFGH